MATPQQIRSTFERNKRALTLRPSLGQKTGRTTVRVRDGTTCEITNGKWSFLADVGVDAGGNDAGPGPSVLERAALGTCLAVGYATWAALLDVPINDLEIESDVDARPMYGLTGDAPGFKAIRYHVRISSPAPEQRVLEVIERADAVSAVRDDFARPIPVERTIAINHTSGANDAG